MRHLPYVVTCVSVEAGMIGMVFFAFVPAEVSMLEMPPHMPIQCTPPNNPADSAANKSGGVSMVRMKLA